MNGDKNQKVRTPSFDRSDIDVGSGFVPLLYIYNKNAPCQF